MERVNTVWLKFSGRFQVHSGAQTGAVFHGADAHQVSVLDGVHVDIVGDAVLPATARVRRSGVRQGDVGVHARLARHGGVFSNAIHTDTGAQPDNHFVHLRVHLRGNQTAEAGLFGSRQGEYILF